MKETNHRIPIIGPDGHRHEYLTSIGKIEDNEADLLRNFHEAQNTEQEHGLAGLESKKSLDLIESLFTYVVSTAAIHQTESARSQTQLAFYLRIYFSYAISIAKEHNENLNADRFRVAHNYAYLFLNKREQVSFKAFVQLCSEAYNYALSKLFSVDWKQNDKYSEELETETLKADSTIH